MTTSPYPQWTPEDFAASAEPSIDPLAEQVASAEDRDVLRDPLADQAPTITHVFNGREPGIITDAPQPDHSQPMAPTVERVQQRGHIDPPPPSSDRFSDDVLDRVEGVPHHRGVLRRHDENGNERYSIRFTEAGRTITQPIDARSLDRADEALAEALAQPGREPIK